MTDSKHIVCPNCKQVNRVATDRLAEDPRCGKCKGPLFEGRPTNLGTADFDRFVGRSGVPVVVDFWAPWCGPCKMMAPAFEQAAQQLEPKVRLAKVNTEEAQDLGMKYGIQAIPTMVIFKDGKEVARQPGAMQLPQILQWVEMHAGV